ncbi:hypothetical protein [Cloacibacterium sp. TD35]|uniref:hypothetical protein n=1 Tax=Cloacibacterium sp. TD35 TaxID=2976818 RepID=UPI00237E5348|nr:hypothetical protein [Cloacibacterium sp. TD35]WDT67624.1 hypothetical protein N7277_09825 [Cloacibacterium sp. TD35]
MNYIIQKLKNLTYHTHLGSLLKPIENDLKEYQFLITDYLFLSPEKDLPIQNFSNNYEIFNAEKFLELIQRDIKFNYGYFAAIPKDKEIVLDLENLPYVEGNPEIWESNLLRDDAEIEIYAYDGSYSVIKLKNSKLSNTFAEYFPEAELLENFQF